MRPALVVLVFVLALVPALGPAAAHGGGAALPGDSLSRARELGVPPARTFDDLVADEPHYYRATFTEGSPLRVVAPAGAEPSGEVWVYVFGADLPNDTFVEPVIERPPGWGALVFLASGSEERVDARLPARFTDLLARDVGEGERVVVLLSEEPARVAVLVEEPGLAWEDLALMPSVRADHRAWGGAPAWLAWVVGAAGALAALAPFARARKGAAWPLASLLGAFAAATFGASTAILVADAVRAEHAPWALLASGIALTAASAWAALPRGRTTWQMRLALLACGLAGIAAWSGFLWGPVAAIAGALIPEPEPSSGAEPEQEPSRGSRPR